MPACVGVPACVRVFMAFLARGVSGLAAGPLSAAVRSLSAGLGTRLVSRGDEISDGTRFRTELGRDRGPAG